MFRLATACGTLLTRAAPVAMGFQRFHASIAKLLEEMGRGRLDGYERYSGLTAGVKTFLDSFAEPQF